MGKVFRIGPILITIVLSFYGLSFGDDLTRGLSPANSSDELVHGQRPLHEKKEASSSWPEKEGLGSILYGAKSGKAARNREISLNPEIADTIQSTGITEIHKEELFLFESSQPSKGKSGYLYGKIDLMKNSLDRSLTFISSLSLPQYEKENPLLWTSEGFKEIDIFKSMAILLELKLNF